MKARKPDGRATKLIEPFAQGWTASASLLSRDDNPYVHDSGAHLEWLKGFESGEDDWQDMCLKKGLPQPKV